MRLINKLRSKFSNPWLNFSAAGSSFGSIVTLSQDLNLAFTISSGRNKFQANELKKYEITIDQKIKDNEKNEIEIGIKIIVDL